LSVDGTAEQPAHAPLRCRPARRPLPAPFSQLLAEIKIHRSLQHRFVVGFDNFFEDRTNVYIMLELCTSQVRPAHCALAATAATLARFSAERRRACGRPALASPMPGCATFPSRLLTLAPPPAPIPSRRR